MSRRTHEEAGGQTPEERTQTVPTAHGADEAVADEDVVSDPALDDRVGSDWADEGGAVPSGPATAAPSGDEEPEDADSDPSEFGEEGLPQITLDPPD